MQLNVMLQKHSDSCFGSEWFRGHVSPGNPGTGSPTAEILPAGVGELSNHKQLAHRLTVWVLSFLSLCWEISGALRCWALSICTHWKGQWLGWLPEIQTPCSGIQWNLYTRNNLRQNYGCREPGVRGGILFCRWKNTRFFQRQHFTVSNLMLTSTELLLPGSVPEGTVWHFGKILICFLFLKEWRSRQQLFLQ